uniref:Invertebrate defensins family profile domain-containing protein n=1 Tax=Anopheles maculatus TaxID=74869 RepID=A0A2C9H4C0_9DIPT
MRILVLPAIVLICVVASVLAADDVQTTCKLFTANVVSSIACKMYCVIKGKAGGYCNSEALCTCRAEDLHFLLKPLVNKSD